MSALLEFSALTTLSSLRFGEARLAGTVGRITSGARMANAGVDGAAWIRGARLGNQTRGWHEATRNIQNGISMLATADGGAAEIGSVLARMRELAVRAANGIPSAVDRQAMHDEATQIRQSIYRAIDATEFNETKLLRGTSSRGPTVVDTSAFTLPATATATTAATQSGTYTVEVTQAAGPAVIEGAPLSVIPAGDSVTMTIQTSTGTATATLTSADPPATWPGIINSAAALAGIDVTASIVVDFFGDSHLRLASSGTGSDSTITVTTDDVVNVTGFGLAPPTAAGADMQGTIDGVAFTAKGLTITGASAAAGGLSLTLGAQPPVGVHGTVTVTVPPEVIGDLTHVVQFAPDHLDEHVVTLPSLRLGALAPAGAGTIGSLDLTTQAGAQTAIDVIDAAISQIGTARVTIGAQAEALESELAYGTNALGLVDAARSRIVDADVASDVSAMLQEQLRQQVGQAALEAIHAQSSAALDLWVQLLRTGSAGATGA